MKEQVTVGGKKRTSPQLTEKFIKKLKKAVFDGAANQLPVDFKGQMQYVTGSVFKSMQPIKTHSGYIRRNIMIIRKGMAAHLLQFGRRSKFWSVNNYPRIVTYKESPHLKKWAKKKGLLKNNPEGIKVGGEHTRFGALSRRWFTNGVHETKQNLQHKILMELRKK